MLIFDFLIYISVCMLVDWLWHDLPECHRITNILTAPEIKASSLFTIFQLRMQSLICPNSWSVSAVPLILHLSSSSDSQCKALTYPLCGRFQDCMGILLVYYLPSSPLDTLTDMRIPRERSETHQHHWWRGQIWFLSGFTNHSGSGTVSGCKRPST